MYKESKKTVLIPYFDKLIGISFDTVLKITSTFFLLYSIGLIIIPNILSKNVISIISLNSILLIVLIALLLWLHFSLWLKTSDLNKLREKEINLGITSTITGIFLLTLLILQLLNPIIGEIINITNWFVLGLFLVIFGISLELTRLDEELVFWLNQNKHIRDRIPITLLIGFAFLSVYSLPLFTYLLILIPWLDLIIKLLYSSLVLVTNLIIKSIKNIFNKLRTFFVNIFTFILNLILIPYVFILSNYRTIIKVSISAISVSLMYFGLFNNLIYSLTGLVVFYLTWHRNVNQFFFSILQGIYNLIINIFRQIQLFFINVYLSVKNFIIYLFSIRIQIVKIISTSLGILINIVVFSPYQFQFKEVLFIFGIFLIYIPWLKSINGFILEVFIEIKRLFSDIIRSLRKFLFEVKLFVKSVIKRIKDFIKQVFNELNRIFNLIVDYRIELAKIASTLIGFILILMGNLYVAGLLPKIISNLLGIGLMYFPWYSKINKFLLALLAEVKSLLQSILYIFKAFLLNVLIFIMSIFIGLKSLMKMLIGELIEFFNYLISNWLKILRIISTFIGFSIIIVGNIYIIKLDQKIMLNLLGLCLLYFPWTSRIHSSIKKIIVFLTESLNKGLNWFKNSIKSIYYGIINILLGIINFLIINLTKIVKIVIANFSILFIFLGIVIYSHNPIQGILLIIFGSSLLTITFFKEIKLVIAKVASSCYHFVISIFNEVLQILNIIKTKFSQLLHRIYYYCNVFVFYCVNWSLIWISVVFGSTIAIYGLILGFSGLIDNSGSWSYGLFNINLLLFFTGVSPFILLILSLGFIFAGILLMRVISEHKENMMLKIVLHPKKLDRRSI
ncbi:MAG: hypothetical protein ACW981_18490 [Candidatus Hodarchaeales archaeon]|jgi:hypothetical protein